MKTAALLTVAVLAASAAFAVQRVEPRWESIDRRPTPGWFEDAKLGIFIHWGVYSVPSFAPRTEVSTYARYSEWYWKRSTTPDIEGHAQFKAFHDRVYGPQAQYQDFWPSAQSWNWNAVDVGPHRDVAGDLGVSWDPRLPCGSRRPAEVSGSRCRRAPRSAGTPTPSSSRV